MMSLKNNSLCTLFLTHCETVEDKKKTFCDLWNVLSEDTQLECLECILTDTKYKQSHLKSKMNELFQPLLQTLIMKKFGIYCTSGNRYQMSSCIYLFGDENYVLEYNENYGVFVCNYPALKTKKFFTDISHVLEEVKLMQVYWTEKIEEKEEEEE